MLYKAALFEFGWTPKKWMSLDRKEKALVIELIIDESKRRDKEVKDLGN